VLIAGVLWLASGGALQKKYDLYLAIEDESVAGLNLNAPVKYNGVDVGKVREIRLDPGNPERVNLLFAIERGTPIKEDTVAVLKTQGLTGIAYVELSGGARDAPPLRATAGSDWRMCSRMCLQSWTAHRTTSIPFSATRTGRRSKARSPTSPPWRTRSPRARTRSTLA
jgi:hypothetical protein